MNVYSLRTLCFAEAILEGHSRIPQSEISTAMQADYSVCGNNDAGEIAEASKGLQQLASEVDGFPTSQHSLDRGDLFRILSEGRYASASTSSPNSSSLENGPTYLRRALDLPVQDSSGLNLNFQVFPLEAGGQVAVTRFEPENLDSQSRPLVFFTGVARRSAIYFNLLSEIARRDRRRIFAVDHPYVGGSVGGGNQLVSSSLLIASAREALTRLFPVGSGFDILAHSLGTVVARHIYMNPSWIDGLKIHRMVLVAPPPTFMESLMGHHFDLLVGIFNFLDVQRSMSPATSEWARRIVHEERNHYDTRSILGWINEESGFLQRLAKNTDLRYVLPLEDQLFPLRSPENWRQVNIFQIPDASHSSLLFHAPHESGLMETEIIRRALNDTLPNPIPRQTLNTQAAIPLSFRFLGALCDFLGIT